MSEMLCMLCKSSVNTAKYTNIDEDYTKYSNLLLRTLLEVVFQHKIILTANLHVCVDCVNLLNELDLADITYRRIRQKLYDYLGYDHNAHCNKLNAYCQTDVFIENVLEFDVKGKNKNGKDQLKVDQPNDFCSYSDSTEALNADVKKEHILKQYECHVCFKKFVSKNGAALHMKKVHSDVNAKCSDEYLNTENLPEVGKLAELDNGISIKDEPFDHKHTSGDNFVTKSEFNDQQDETKPYKGNRGRKKKYPDILKPYKCTSCPKTWKTLGELKSHFSAHSDTRPFICEICGQAYKHKTALDIHVGMHNGIYPFMCTYCNKSFTQKGALQRHLPIHTGETPYQCDLCGKRFVHHTSFNIHQLSHSGQKDYKCIQCGLALLSGSHLKRHMRVHTGERNYACSFCGKRFAERYNLASHQKLHENPGSSAAFKRNHRCQICGTAFNRRLKLDEHMAKDHQKVTITDAPLIQQLFTKSDAESVWPVYSSVKIDKPETSY